jgi:hypothetical protein
MRYRSPIKRFAASRIFRQRSQGGLTVVGVLDFGGRGRAVLGLAKRINSPPRRW